MERCLLWGHAFCASMPAWPLFNPQNLHRQEDSQDSLTSWSNQNHNLQVIHRLLSQSIKWRGIEEDAKHWPLAHSDTHAPAQTWAHTQHKTKRNLDITVLSCQKSEDTRKTDRTLCSQVLSFHSILKCLGLCIRVSISMRKAPRGFSSISSLICDSGRPTFGSRDWG